MNKLTLHGATRRLRVDWPLLWAVAIAVMGILQFAIAIPLAMEEYPGGTITDRNSIGYSWSENWISDLGRESALNGQPNGLSSRIFRFSMVTLGSSLLVFFILSHRANCETTLTTFIASTSGIVTAIGLIGIGMTPMDKYLGMHEFMNFHWFTPLIGLIGAFSYQAIRSGWITAVVFTVASLILFVAMIYCSLASLASAMTAQKVFVITALLWLVLLIARVGFAVFYVEVESCLNDQLVKEHASDYLRRLNRENL